MLFEIVFTSEKGGNGFSSYAKDLAPDTGLQLIEHFPPVTVIEGEWDAAMNFLRQCHDYVQKKEEVGSGTVTTVHIHS